MFVTNDNYKDQWIEVNTYLQNTQMASAGIATANTTASSLSSMLVTPGYLFMKNLDDFNTVTWGTITTGTLSVVGTLKSDEQAILRVNPAGTTIGLKASAASNVKYLFLND